jgi:membrane protein
MPHVKWSTFSGQILRVLRSAFSDWLDHRCSSKGAALAYYTLFSMAPILVLVIAIAGLFWGADAASGQIFHQLKGLVGSQSAEAIQLVLRGARDHDAGVVATVVAGVLLLFGATTVFAELKDSLDEIWDLPPPKNTGVWDAIRTRLLSFGIILVLAFLLMVSLVVSAALDFVENYLFGSWKSSAVVLSWLASGVSFLVIAVMFGTIYKLLPRIPLAWRDVVVGALGTAAMFEVGKYLIGLYIGNSGVASSFGAAGSLIALLVWVYYSAQIFFFGAEFARRYALELGSLKDRPPEQTGADRPAKKTRA